MNVYLTFDYELFFGNKSGSVEKSLLEPTNYLFDLSEKYNVFYTFFVDIGYILALEKYQSNFPKLQKDYKLVLKQIETMIRKNHSVQLHIHPHWEKSIFDGKEWINNTSGAYKLSDFTQEEIESIVRKYKKRLDEITGQKSYAFRAGGWCIQPFSKLKNIFRELEITLDSSVMPGAKFDSGEYAYDFENAPKKSKYNFDNDVCEEVVGGYFLELPITSITYSPWFYWRLYILGRLFPKQYKMIGDGIFMSQPGRKKSVLTNYTTTHVSTDGYYSTKLDFATKKELKQNSEEMVIIGHPKSCTLRSIRELDKYLSKNKNVVKFKVF